MRFFPALWDVDWQFGDARIKEDGLDFPLDERLSLVHEDRQYHSYVTRVELEGTEKRGLSGKMNFTAQSGGKVRKMVRGLDAALGGHGKKIYRRLRPLPTAVSQL